MAKTKESPVIIETDRFEDIQSIGNISQIYDKLVKPIDQQFRSIATAPGLGANTTSSRGTTSELERTANRSIVGQYVDTGNFIESRTHAFYRMAGFPVVSQDGFYNSGHNPDHGSSLSNRTSVDNSLRNKNPDIINLAGIRENDALSRRLIFDKQNTISSAYTLLMRNQKTFLIADINKEPFYVDYQKQVISGRKEDIESFNISSEDKSTIKSVAESVSHILKPFIVIPDIENAVAPNYKRRVCVPFLRNVKDAKTTSEIYLKRPIIEYILRKRLEITGTDTTFLNVAKNLLQTNTTSNNYSNIKTALLAISGETDISVVNKDILDKIQGFTEVQSSTIILFTKSIQSLIIEYDKNIREYDQIINEYSIQPIPHKSGPEFGGKIKENGNIKQKSQLDQRIASLKLNRLISQMQSQLHENIGNDYFASAVVADINKDFDESIKKLESERDSNGARAINNLKIIEIIGGEISGLGLIDILAIYTALWTINIEDLLGLLDNIAIVRLNEYFPYLSNSNVKTQISQSRPDIFTVLSNFEKVLFNILSYSDKMLTQIRQGPKRGKRGIIQGI